MLLSGVSMPDPERVYLDADVTVGQDSVVHPGTHLRAGTTGVTTGTTGSTHSGNAARNRSTPSASNRGALAQSADGAGTLKARTLAMWVAQNRIANAEFARDLPAAGRRSGDASQGGTAFVWRESVGATPNPAFRRVDVEVAEAARAEDQPRRQ